MAAIIAIWVCILISVYWFIKIYKTDQRHKYSTVVSGCLPEASIKGALSEEEKVLFYEYSRQQRYAFALYWSSLAIATVLSGIFIGRLVFAKTIDIGAICSVIGFIGDITLCAGAFKLYQSASSRLEKLQKKLLK